MANVVLVYDGHKTVVPEVMGAPRADQLQGSEMDKCAELCGRVSYDSLGRGRPSREFHEHLREERHLSVYRHLNLTFGFQMRPNSGFCVLAALISRPGVHVTGEEEGAIFFTANLQSVMEWHKHPVLFGTAAKNMAEAVGISCRRAFREECPLAYPYYTPDVTYAEICPDFSALEPRTDDEIYASVFLSDISRVAADELLRHSWKCAPSMECLAGDTLVKFRNMSNGRPAATHWRSMEHLYLVWSDPRIRCQIGKMHVQVYDEASRRFATARVTGVVKSGKKPCFTVHLKDGKSLTCTKDHRILTDSGWKTLEEICRPSVTSNGVCSWNSDCRARVATNGMAVVGDGLYRDHQWLYERYYVDELSLEEMANLCGCSTHAIRKWLRIYGLQKTMEEINLGNTPWNKGRTYRHQSPRSPEHRRNIGLAKTGPSHPNWKGGITGEARLAFGRWKREEGNVESVLSRDGFRCRLCNRPASEIPPFVGQRRRCLDINHIVPLWVDPSRACDINNMIILCWECHCTKVNGHELEFVSLFSEMTKSPVPYIPAGLVRPGNEPRPVRAKFQLIDRVEYAGEVETYDLSVSGDNHGFVANGIVTHNSTRYVNLDKRNWVYHPLLLQEGKEFDWLRDTVKKIEFAARASYNGLVNSLTTLCPKAGIKQIRGAARGILGLSVGTRFIFTASLSAWKGIFRMRISSHADDEILAVMRQVRSVLTARWPDRFPEENTPCTTATTGSPAPSSPHSPS